MIKKLCKGFLSTPPLWTDHEFGIQQFEFPSVDLASFHPNPIPTNLRLGHQMEHVFKQLVEYSKVYDVLLYNLPLKQEGITKGEIDFVVQNNLSKQFTHVELTYKFYLIDPAISEPIHQLIGPNRRDTFFKKIEKIKGKQFPLLHSEAGAKVFDELGILPSEIEQECCFKAQLFQPYGNQEIGIGFLNKDCLTGYWLRLNDFNAPEFTKSKFYIPTKSEWVIEPHDQVVWEPHTQILDDIEQSLLAERSPMVWRKNDLGVFEKLFVVWW